MNVTFGSTLLDLAIENDAIAAEAGGTTWRTGVGVLDNGLPERLWEGGRVIGVGGVGAAGGGGAGGRMARVSYVFSDGIVSPIAFGWHCYFRGSGLDADTCCIYSMCTR